MRNRKKTSIFDKICSKIFNWAAGKLLESLPVIGPIYKVVSLVNDVHSATRRKRQLATLAA
jgi:hypothetical protein